MTVVLLRQDDSVLVRDAGLVRRIRARLLAHRLDEDLARGASPDASIEHSLRATRLAGRQERLVTAAALERVLHEAVRPARPTVSVSQPMSGRTRAAVLSNAYELTRLAQRLSSSDPVSSRGLAQARLLTTDGAGPLHHGRSPERLRRTCAEILDALEPEVERP
jgi:hypothetical protein